MSAWIAAFQLGVYSPVDSRREELRLDAMGSAKELASTVPSFSTGVRSLEE